MTGKIKVLLSLLLIALLVGCGSKTDDGLHIENTTGHRRRPSTAQVSRLTSLPSPARRKMVR